MPQMAPLNWLSLFMFFTFIFLMFGSMNYFSFIYKKKINSLNLKLNSLNWKW